MSTTPPPDDFEFGPEEPPPTRAIKNRLLDYPKGIGIFHELIQNADDAGATLMRIQLDETQYHSETLPLKKMSVIQAPALAVFNDARFTNEDWTHLQSVGVSSKETATDKTGKYGIGFQSVYHVTDWPVVLSGSKVILFDPHRNVIEEDYKKRGHGWLLSRTNWTDYPDFLSVFTSFGLKRGQTDFDGTVIRLPLRDDSTAPRSEISQEPFSPQNFEDLLTTLVEESHELLLFLNNLLELHVTRLHPDGTIENILSIETQNAQEVRDHRSLITKHSRGSPTTVLEHIREDPNTDPLIVEYDHMVTIQRPTKPPMNHTWSVVRGLIAGPNNTLLDAAQNLNEYGNKAIPLVGAATRIEHEPREPLPSLGRLFCTLPVATQSSRLPFHINGFFDLTSNRQGVFQDEGVTGKDETRVEWNHLLIQHGIAKVAARLLTRVAKNTDTHYDHWPRVTQGADNDFLQALPKQVYEQLLSHPCISCGQPRQLQLPRNVALLTNAKSELQNALLADDLPIPVPVLPQHVIAGFNETTEPLQKMSPEKLRNELVVENDPNQPFQESERRSLTKKDWICAMLEHCCSDKKHDDLKGVPLALTDAHVLHAFGLRANEPVYTGTKAERTLLSSCNGLFLDEEVEFRLGVKRNDNAGVDQMTAQELTSRLSGVLCSLGDGYRVKWDPTVSGIPEEEWLITFYEYLTAAEGYSVDQSVLETLPLVPDQFGDLRGLGNEFTPLLPSRKDEQAPLIEALRHFRVPLVDATTDTLFSAITSFDNKCKGAAIWEITGRDLIDTLAAVKDDWEDSTRTYAQDIHDPLLNFFSTTDVLIQFQSEKETRSEELKALRIFPTTDGRLVSLSDEDVYLPGGFDPPPIDADLSLLDSGPDACWLPLLKALEVPEQTLAQVIRLHLLPRYEQLDADNQRGALRWLRSNFESACLELTDDRQSADEFRLRLKQAPLIVCTDDQIRAGSSLYAPEVQSVVEPLIGRAAAFPDMETTYADPGDNDGWREFFEKLGMVDEPRPKHLLAAVDDAVKAADANPAGATETLKTIATHLSENWETFRDELVDDEINDGSAHPATLTLKDALRKRKWLPALQNPPKHLPGRFFKRPETQLLFEPNQLYAQDELFFVSLVAPVSELRLSPQMQNDIGLKTKPDVDDVTEQLKGVVARVCRQLDDSQKTTTDKDTAKLLVRLYKRLGTLWKEMPKNSEKIQGLKRSLCDKRCIVDSDRRLWIPDTTFKKKITPVFKDLRASVHFTNENIERFLSFVGRRDEPEVVDFEALLQKVTNDFQNVEEKELSSVRKAYEAAANITDPAHRLHEIPILTDDGSFRPGENVVLDDAPWFSERLRNSGVGVLDGELAKIPEENSVAKAFGVALLSKAVSEQLLTRKDCSDEEVKRACETYQNIIRTQEFSDGVLRLLRCDPTHLNVDPGDLSWFEELEVFPQEVFTTELVWEDTKEPLQNSTNNGDVLYEQRSKRILVSTSVSPQIREVRLCKILTQELEQRGYSFTDSHALVVMLQKANPKGIEGLLDELRIPQLRGDPTTIDIASEPNDDGFIDEQFGSDTHSDVEGDAPSDETPASPGSPKPPETPPETLEGREPIAPPPGPGEPKPIRKPKPSPKPRPPSVGGPRPRTKGRRKRGVIYQAPPTEGAGDEDPAIKAKREKIERAAVEFVLAFEEDNERTPEEMPANNPGFDVKSTNETTGAIRHIEVKGTGHEWDSVDMTSRQFEECQQEQDSFWLYVVEFALESNKTRLFTFKNPVALTARYRIVSDWKEIATERNDTAMPIKGARIKREDGTEGTIEEVKPSGALKRLTVRLDSGEMETNIWNAETMTVLHSEEED